MIILIQIQIHALCDGLVRKRSKKRQITVSLHCDLDPEDRQVTFSHKTPQTLQLLLMNHHIKFGYKRLSSSEDIVRTKLGKHMDMVIQNSVSLAFILITITTDNNNQTTHTVDSESKWNFCYPCSPHPPPPP